MKNKMIARHLIEGFSGISALASLFIALSPFAFDYPRSSGRAALDLCIGGLSTSAALFGVLGAYDARLFSGLNMGIACFALISPWLANCVQIPAYFHTHMVCGSIILVCSALALIVTHTSRPIEAQSWLHSPS